jgi:hypothetical protein
MTPAPRNYGLLHRTARTLCPRGERAWIDAMFAELHAVDAPRRPAWAFGAFAIVLSGIRLRIGSVPALVWWTMLIVAHAVVIFAIASQTDFEHLRMDDDVCMRFAWVSGGLLVGLGVLAITWIFNHTDRMPRQH